MAQVQNDQTIFDICLQEFGTLENLFDDVVVPNKVVIDRPIKTDQEINVNTINKGNSTVKDQIKEQGLVFTNAEIEAAVLPTGIGTMIINSTFIVGP